MSEARREWLLLMFELPASHSNLRVKVWRRLQKVGALNLKNSVYVLPKSPETEEDFEWLRQTIVDGGGEATMMSALAVAGPDDKDLVNRFQEARMEEYKALRKTVQGLSAGIKRMQGKSSISRFGEISEGLGLAQETLSEIRKVDFFPSSFSREVEKEVEEAWAQLKRATESRSGGKAPAPIRVNPKEYQVRLWVTREGMHVDRLVSAWLIRRFIDPKAKFGFVKDKSAKSVPAPGIPFDMAGAEFGHHGEDCTFETLLNAFALAKDPALASLAEIIHDVDIKDGKFGRGEAHGLDLFVRSLRESTNGDLQLLKEGERFFSALHKGLSSKG